jgi:hypothetical protein
MKNATSITLLSILIMTTTGCSMFGGKTDEVEAQKRKSINNQVFSEVFEEDGIRVNWECTDRDWFPSLGIRCDERSIKSIAVTVTTPTNGGTNMNVSNAMLIGEESAKSKLAMFIDGTTETSTQTNISGFSNETQDDTYRNRISGTGQNNDNAPRLPAVVGITSSEPQAPRDPNPNMNFAVTSNSNISKRDIRVTIQSQAKIMIKGMQYTHDQADDQLLQTTGTWYKDVSDTVITLKNSNF